MANTQTTLQFCVRKKQIADFYPAKVTFVENVPRIKCNEKEKQPDKNVYVPRVKKLVELDSGDENIDLTNVRVPLKKQKRKYVKKSQVTTEDSSDSDCSPPKRAYTKKTLKCVSKSSSTDDEHGPLDSCSSQPENFKSLPGREPELEKLTYFLNDHLEQQNSASLYISGPPGTGKTACLMNILERPEFKKGFTEVYINCTTMKSAGSIFNRICQELRIKATSGTEKASLTAINKHLSGKHNMILLVLDEIDQLINKKQSVLYTVFEWPLRAKSKIVLVGIANALDLTDRVLPRLHARPDLQLELMHFLPYTKQQIINIFTAKLKEEMTTDLFSPLAIQMLAGKVAAISGDIRRALDIGKRVIDLASPKTYANKASDKMDKNCTVELKQVMSVLNDVYGASQRLEIDMDDTFPLQQKILICTLMLLLNKGNNKNITLGKLHDVYKRVCKRRNILAVDSTEFVGLCGLVETRGIIRLSGKKEARMHKVILQWDEDEVTNALSDKKMISDILSDVNCLT